MPFSCPNKNTPEWRKLFLAVGKDRAYDLYTENNFDIPTEFVVRAQDIRKIIKLYKTEIGQDKLIKVKKALDRYNTVNNTSHSLDITPIGESTESKVKLVLNFNPRNAQKYQDKLDRRSEEDKMFKELEEESETEEFVRDIHYFMGDEQLMQQEDGVFYQTDKPIKPGVQELFESNPELANQVYEALGFGQENISVSSTLFEAIPNITETQIKSIYDNYVALMGRVRSGKEIRFSTFQSLIQKYQVIKQGDTYIFGQYDVNNGVFISRLNSSPSSRELLANVLPNIVKQGIDVISFVPEDVAKKYQRSGYLVSEQGFDYNFKGEDMIKYLATTNPEKVKQIFGKDISEITGEEIKNYNSQQELKYTPVEINSSLIEKAGKDASKILETYLNQFGIVVKDINEIKDKLNIDEVGFADILSKIAYVKDKKDLPPIAGEFIAYMMQYNPLVSDIIKELSQTDNYKNLEKSEYFKIIGGLISDDLQNKLENNYSKSLLNKLKQLIKDFFSLLNNTPIDLINKNIGIISNNILQQNKKLITASLYKPGAFGKPIQQVNIEEALKKDKFGANIIYKLSKVGFILTGSTALSEQGVILRPNENPLHDIDWVSPFSRKETEEKFLKFYPNAIKVRDIYGDGYMTDSYLIAPEGYSISNYKADNFNGKIIINSYDVVDSKGNVVGTYRLQKQESNNQSKEVVAGIEGKVIDFFSYENYSGKNTNKPFNYKSKEGTIIQLANWKDIFKAKLNFARYKDIWDYNRFIPNENANQITQQQKQQALQTYQSFLDIYLQDFLTTDGYYALEEVLVVNKIIDRKCN